jgi:hypothetical protein
MRKVIVTTGALITQGCAINAQRSPTSSGRSALGARRTLWVWPLRAVQLPRQRKTNGMGAQYPCDD